MTLEDLINKVMRALREDVIDASLPDGYPTLVAQFINEAKEDIEDMGPWYALRTTLNFTLTSGTATLTLTGTNERSYLLREPGNQPLAFITTANTERRLAVIEQTQMDSMHLFSPDAGNDTPCYVSFSRSADGVTAKFYPTPDAAYTVRFVFVIPQAELTAADDEITIPGTPVWRAALVLAMDERGEEFSAPLARRERQAEKALNAALQMDFLVDEMTFVAE